MGEETSLQWGMNAIRSLDGNPCALAQSSCLHAVQVARDVSIDETALPRYTAQLRRSY